MSGINVIKHYKSKLSNNTCWVIALGTNDAASSQKPNDSTRITLTMEALDGDPVVWVNVWMNSKTRPNYSSTAARKWNTLLSNELSIYTKSYILDWDYLAKRNPSWFSTDGYHYSSFGYQQRSEMITLSSSYVFYTLLNSD